jgi:uncharacterized RDD family membrane protein YckC
LTATQAINSPGIFRRLASMFYDGLLVLAILFVATFAFIWLFGNATEAPQRYFLQIYLWLVAAIYFLICWLRGGQTLAMQTWRIRLTNHAGGSISWRQALVRYLLASLGLLFFGAGFLWAAFDRQGLFLHDRLIGSRLVATDS